MDSGTSIFKGAALPTALAGGVALLAGLVLDGAKGAAGAAVGTAVVVVFFSISAYVVNWAAKISPQTLMLAGIASYVVKVLGMMILISSFRDVTLWNTVIFGWTVVALAVVWIVAEFRITLQTRRPYIDEPTTDRERGVRAGRGS